MRQTTNHKFLTRRSNRNLSSINLSLPASRGYGLGDSYKCLL